MSPSHMWAGETSYIFFSIPDSRHVSQNAISSLPLHQDVRRHMSSRLIPGLQLREGKEKKKKKKKLAWKLAVFKALALKV